jgi:hypothetical protein
MRPRWQRYADGVTRADSPALHDDRHHPRLAHQLPVGASERHPCQKSWLDVFDLGARIPKTGHGKQSVGANAQRRPDWQAKEIDAGRRDILAQVARSHLEPLGSQFGKQLLVDEMDLAQIRLRGIDLHAGSMLHGAPGVCVPVDSDSSDQPDRGHLML